jgi:hypothetical protein
MCERPIVTSKKKNAGVGLIDLEVTSHLQSVGYRDEAFRFRIRERPQQDRIDDAEGRGRGAEAHCQRQERGDGEAGGPP